MSASEFAALDLPTALLRAMGAHSRLEAVLMGLRGGVISANSTQAYETAEPAGDESA